MLFIQILFVDNVIYIHKFFSALTGKWETFLCRRAFSPEYSLSTVRARLKFNYYLWRLTRERFKESH